MSAREIAGRIAGELRIKRLRRAASQPEAWGSRILVPAADVIDRCVGLVPGAAPDQLSNLESEHPEYLRSLQGKSKALAQKIEVGDFELLGKRVVIRPNIDWHSDPSTGYVWPDKFFGDVSYHKIPEHVDFKDIWEMGRQQYVVELSRSWLLNGNTEHGMLAREMMLSWIDGNPFCKGIHWTSGLEVAMRAISWIWTLANLSQFPDWKQGERERIVTSLGLHAYYLENHFSYYSSPYNHVIGEATGLCLIALVMRGTSHATRWQRLAIRVLRDFGPKQFYSDGFCVEQAMGYHYYTLGFLVLADLALKHLNESESKLGLDDLLVRAFRAGLLFQQPDGSWPAIGDVDSAQSIPVARDNYWDFSPTHQLAAVVLDAPEIACPPTSDMLQFDSVGFGDELYWLTGCEGLQRRSGFATASRNFVTILPAAGYYVAGDARDQIVFDAGPISHGLHSDSTSSAAHGHADTLQVLYQFDGRNVLCDSGMPIYAGNQKRAAHFRSPQAHNTVTFAGADLVRPAGGLNWSNEVQTPTLGEASQTRRWIASGEVSWPDCRITRHVLAIPGEGLWVADWLQSEIPRIATWYWQFTSESGLKLNSSEKSIHATGNDISVHAVGTKHLKAAAIAIGDESGEQGWSSPGYGIRHSSCQLRYSTNVDGRLLVLTGIGNSTWTAGFEVETSRLFLNGENGDLSEQLVAPLVPMKSIDADPDWDWHESAGRGRWLIQKHNS